MHEAKRRARALAIPTLALCALALAGAVSCGGSNQAPPDLKVVSHAPADKRTDQSEAIQLRFDKPVVAESEIGTAVPSRRSASSLRPVSAVE